MKTRMILSAIGMAAAAFAGAGCKQMKPTDDSATKSLDNFAAGFSVSENSCSGTGEREFIDDDVAAMIENMSLIEADGPMAEVVSEALGALPVNMLNLYFGTGNRIVVSDSAFDGRVDMGIEDCQLAKSAGTLLDGPVEINERPELASCVVYENKGMNGSGEKRLSIYIKPNSAAIRHSLVRRVSQAVSLHLSALTKDANGNLEIGQAEDAAFTAWKQSMVAALDRDVAGQPQSAVANYRKLRSSLPAAEFGHYAFAEAMDSYYCSTKTRESMKRQFPSAFAEFEGLDADLRAMWSESDDSGDSTALGLAGGAAGTVTAKRGPVRRVLRGVGRAAVGTARVVGRAAVGTARVAGRVAFGAARVAVRGGAAVVRGGAAVVRRVGRGIAGEVQFRRQTGYVFPRMRGYRRR